MTETNIFDDLLATSRQNDTTRGNFVKQSGKARDAFFVGLFSDNKTGHQEHIYEKTEEVINALNNAAITKTCQAALLCLIDRDGSLFPIQEVSKNQLQNFYA